jgi:antitoxin component YwqK of YwqJK toxin-antitoxin module
MCKYYHPNGKIKHEGNYINDKSEGIHKYYFDTGIIESEENLSQDERNGLCKYYHPNGKIKQEGNYINEKSDGLFKYYFDNGGIEAIENFKQDERNGICKYYYPNGKLTQEGNYINGKSDGIFRFYFETGILQTEQNKKNGKSHGIIKTYYENGQIRIKGTIDTTSMYENNYLGDLYNYNEDGTLKGHWYINRDGTEVDKLASSNNSIATSNNTNTSNSTDENRPYKCICCKSTINGLKEGVDKSGSQYSDKYLYLYENGFKMDNNLRRSLGFPTYSSVYEYLRSEYFVFCTMKCSKLCAER